MTVDIMTVDILTVDILMPPPLACNTYLGEHYDQVLAKSTGWLWLYIWFYILQ